MMGRAHALSGAAIWLAGTAAYSYYTKTPADPAIIGMGTAVFAGAAICPDFDSNSATAPRSLGFIGAIIYNIVNALGVTVYGITKTRNDEPKTNGHRTLMHTGVMAVLLGLLSFFLTSIPGSVEIFGKTFQTGDLIALGIMSFFLHLGIAALFSKQVKKARGMVGPYILMAVSVIITIITATFLPTATDENSYQWLAFAVGGGTLIHILGDLITKMGVPLLWPIKIRGKRWYDVSLPAAFRITAGGSFEMVILTPIFILLITVGTIAHIMLQLGLL